MTIRMMRILAVIGALAALAITLGCAPRADTPVFFAEKDPTHLADWNVLQIQDGQLIPTPGVIAYDLNTPLFSDYAHKLRTVWIPPGKRAQYRADAEFDLPVGSILSKTFYYPVAGDSVADPRLPRPRVQRTDQPLGLLPGGRLQLAKLQLIETRLLVRREAGWHAVSYVWDTAQRAARLQRAGEVIPIELGESQKFDYVVPDVNQCAGCHATDVKRAALAPIGFKGRHLNRNYDYGDSIGRKNQLAYLKELDLLEYPPVPQTATPPMTGRPFGAPARSAVWNDESEPLHERARAYLDINCGHCHNRQGPADTSGLSLDALEFSPVSMGLCKPPIAAGRGTGDRKFDIVPGRPDESIMVYRMASTDPGAMMPELGRTLAHAEGVELIRRWIAAWPAGPGCIQEASNSARHSASSARLSRSQG